MLRFECEGRKKPMSYFEDRQAGGILTHERIGFCVLVRPSTDRTHVTEGNLLYSGY